ncbi:MAG: oligosaccharide flippase family protein [Nitrospira sp.]|jgi:O-antigen/teichoic acid export membrane protein|nr:oligosaccharide flippase family protein [Nitrospira sp.]
MFGILLGIGGLQILGMLVNIARTKVLALWVGPEGIGIISSIDQTIQFVTHVCTLSLPFAAVKFLSKAHSEGGEAFRDGYVVFLKVLLFLSTVGALVAAGVVLFRADLFPAKIVPYQTLLVLGLLGIPATALAGLFPNVLAAAQQSTGSARLIVFTGIAMAVAGTLGLLAGGITGLYVASVCTITVLAVVVVEYLRRTLGLSIADCKVGIVAGFRRMGNVVSFSFLFYLGAIMSTGALLVTRYAVLETYGEAEAGFLQAGMAVALLMSAVLTPLNGLFFTPRVNRAGPKEEKFHVAVEFQKQMAMIVTVVSIPALLFPHVLLALAFSPKFLVAAQYMFLFMLWQTFTMYAGIYQALLIGLDDMVSFTTLSCLGSILAACSAVVLVPQYGVIGAASGFVAASALVTLGTFVRLKRWHGFVLPARLVWLMGYSLLVTVVLGGIFRQYDGWQYPMLLSKAAVALGALVGLFLFLSAKDRVALMSFSHKVRSGAW